MKKLQILLLLIFSLGCKKEIIQFSLTTNVNPLNSGTISPSSGTFETGQKITLTATPSAEYIFKNWEGDLSGSNNPSELLINSDKNISGFFEKRPYPLNLTIEGSGTVSEEIVTVSNNSIYPSGTSVKLTANASENWKFNSWKGDINSTEISVTLNIDSPKNVTAEFIEDSPFKVHFIKIINPPSNWGSTVSHSFQFEFNQNEYFLGGGVNWNSENHETFPLYRLIRNNENWETINIYSEVEMNEIRNHEFSIDGQNLIICDTGPEWPDIEWPYSNTYVGKLSGNSIQWTKVSNNKSFFHDASFGDINYDGFIDVIAGHLGTRHSNYDNPLVFFGKSDGTFEENYNVLPNAPEGGCCGDVEVLDFDQDGKLEIMRIGGYWEKEIFDIVKYNANTNSFEIFYQFNEDIPNNPTIEEYTELKKVEIYSSNFKGYMPSNKRFYDFNNDGYLDFVNEKDGLTIWYGEENLKFKPFRINQQATDDSGLGIWKDYYPMSGWDAIDLENDGDPDIVTRHFTLGNPNYNDGINLENMIYINDNGKFKRLKTGKYLVKNDQLSYQYPGSNFTPIIRNGKLWFIGSEYQNEGNGPFPVMLEIETNIPASYWYGK